jgi:hypothetical protein
MVDQTDLTVIGSIVVVIGLGFTLMAGRLAHSHAEYLRSGRTKPRPLKLPPLFDSPEKERLLRISLRVNGLFFALTGALWIAGIGAK